MYFNFWSCNFYDNSLTLSKLRSPLLEVTVEDSAGETLSADSDAFQHTVTPQLVDDQMVLHKTWNL